MLKFKYKLIKTWCLINLLFNHYLIEIFYLGRGLDSAFNIYICGNIIFDYILCFQICMCVNNY